MTYIITTTTRADGMERSPNRFGSVTRVEVATLFEAREEAACLIERIAGGADEYEGMYTDAQCCSELGDTFGPLPDGTVITVEVAS